MASPFAVIDLSKLPPPELIESLGVEALVEELKADYLAANPDFTADLESEPVIKLLETVAYREVLLRQRINDAGRSVMLAYARGVDLEHLAALFGLERKLLTPGDANAIPPADPTYEDDATFRARVQLSLEGFSAAGPVGAYVFRRIKPSSMPSPPLSPMRTSAP